MMAKRVLAAVAVTGTLAGCQTTPEMKSTSGAPKPFERTGQPVPAIAQYKDGKKVTATEVAAPAAKPAPRPAVVLSQVRIVGADVDVSTASKAKVRGFTFSDAQAEAALARGVMGALANVGAGQTAVRLQLSIDRLYVPNAVAGAVFGSNYPYAGGVLQMVDARSGKPVGDAVKVFAGGAKAAGGQFRPGLIGAAMQPGEAKDFDNLAAALGLEIRKALLKAQK